MEMNVVLVKSASVSAEIERVLSLTKKKNVTPSNRSMP